MQSICLFHLLIYLKNKYWALNMHPAMFWILSLIPNVFIGLLIEKMVKIFFAICTIDVQHFVNLIRIRILLFGLWVYQIYVSVVYEFRSLVCLSVLKRESIYFKELHSNCKFWSGILYTVLVCFSLSFPVTKLT